MKQKKNYVKPELDICNMQVEHLLTIASGQHEHIGQGGTVGSAKQGWYENEEDEEESDD